jgi:hypothetical protein
MLIGCSRVQLAGVPLVGMLQLLQGQDLHASVEMQVKQLLLDPAVQGMLLQPLVATAAVLHQQHVAQQQVQQQQQQQQRCQKTGAMQQVCIPACHQDVPVPGGQAYIEAAKAALAALPSRWDHVDRAVSLLAANLQRWRKSDCFHEQGYDAVMLSAAAVRLVLELQLLAAEEVRRRQQQQQQQQQLLEEDVTRQVCHCNTLLALQIKLTLQRSGGSCLPPEVLQQAGLQLLQALLAPVQLLDRGMPTSSVLNITGSGQLYALRAAAEGAPNSDTDQTCKHGVGGVQCSASAVHCVLSLV